MCDTKLVNSLSSLKKKNQSTLENKVRTFSNLNLDTEQLHMESDYWKQRF